MKCQGVQLAIGQWWRTSDGETVQIIGDDAEYPVHHWLANNKLYYNDAGRPDNGNASKKLFCQIHDSTAADDHQALTFHNLEPAANDGNVGDINSQEKGSGARFNAGKPPLHLIPFRQLAAYYRGAIIGKDAEIDALEYVGKFQERLPGDHLTNAVLSLGGGWDECAHVFDYGRIKYKEWNWAKGMKWSVPLACAARHLIAMIESETNDPESKLPHRGHVLCNIVMLGTFVHTFKEGDDRAQAGLLWPEAVTA